MQKAQDDYFFIAWDRVVNSWSGDLPTVGAARPCSCVRCGVVSQPIGEPLRVHGHGVRVRQVWGVIDGERMPELHEVTLRRYRCVWCKAIMVVGPKGLVSGYRYSLASIVAALWMWSLGKQTAAKVRDRLSPLQTRGFAGATRWGSLARWARKLPWLSESLAVLGSARQMAERGVQIALSGLAQMPSTLAGVVAAAARLG